MMKPHLTTFGSWDSVHPFGGAIRLTAAEMERDALAAGEGIESSLSWVFLVRRGLAEAGAAPACDIWAADTLGNICGVNIGRGGRRPRHDDRIDPEQPQTGHLPSRRLYKARPGLVVPGHIKRLTILRENDSRDPRTYQALLSRAIAWHEAEGREVAIADPGGAGDFNDLIRAGQR